MKVVEQGAALRRVEDDAPLTNLEWDIVLSLIAWQMKQSRDQDKERRCVSAR